MKAAARAAGVSRLTMTRWLESGDRLDGYRSPGTADHHSLWVGYPPPLPLLDRLSELSTDPEAGFIHTMTTRKPGMLELWASGARELRVDEVLPGADLSSAPAQLGISHANLSRISDTVPYPREWERLDKLCLSTVRMRWLEAVIRWDPRTITAQIPAEALVVMFATIGVGSK